MYMIVNLRNLFHFLSLRLHAHAQMEIRVYAEAILQILKSIKELQWSVEIFEEINELEYSLYDVLNEVRKEDRGIEYLRQYIVAFSEKSEKGKSNE